MIKAELAHNAEPMTEHYITAEHLKQMTVIARVSGEEPGKRVWTELGIYYRHHFNRPFVAVVIGAVRDNEPTMVPKFRSFAAGTLDRAAGWFQGSTLTDQLLRALPNLSAEEAARFYPDHNQMKHEARALRDGAAADRIVGAAVKDAVEHGIIGTVGKVVDDIIETGGKVLPPMPNGYHQLIGFGGRTLTDAAAWLFPDATSAAARATLIEQHFGMPARTVRRALAIDAGTEGEQGAWVAMFIAAMRCFDRTLWRVSLEAEQEKAGIRADTMATIANDKG